MAIAQEIVVPPPFDPKYFGDSTRADSAVAPAPAVDTSGLDSVLPVMPAAAAEDTTWKRFVPPSQWRAHSDYRVDALLAGPDWPMPPLASVAGGDFADWLAFHPAYDVDEARGVGQPRFFTRWGLEDRQGGWSVDGRAVRWQRLTFPMSPQFDPAILPSYTPAEIHAGEQIILLHDTSWSERPQFDFSFYQGDFSDTYSEGKFRAHTKRGFGLDLAGTFFSSDGRFVTDNRDKRILSLETFGPVRKNFYWRARYTQFRDKSAVLSPEPFDFMRPTRDDLLWTGEIAVARIVDLQSVWQVAAQIQSGRQRMSGSGYSTSSADKLWQLHGWTQLAGWQFHASAGLDELEIDSTDKDRFVGGLSVSRLFSIANGWTGALRVSAGDRPDAPVPPGATVTLSPKLGTILPTIRLSRTGTAHSLFDTHRPLSEFSFIDASQTGFLYSEAGDGSLDDQWDNSLDIRWGHDHFSDSTNFGWTIAGHAAYVENYTRWQGRADYDTVLGNPVLHYRYRSVAADARSFGAAVGIHGRLFWKIHFLTHYAAKYAADLDNVKLSGYHPHKGAAVLSLIAPKWKYGVDLRLDAAGLWWYGDTRIDPSGYESSHVFRFDLSGSARVIGDLTVYARLQNVANFPYRTAAGFPFTGRTVRFGFNVTLYD